MSTRLTAMTHAAVLWHRLTKTDAATDPCTVEVLDPNHPRHPLQVCGRYTTCYLATAARGEDPRQLLLWRRNDMWFCALTQPTEHNLSGRAWALSSGANPDHAFEQAWATQRAIADKYLFTW